MAIPPLLLRSAERNGGLSGIAPKVRLASLQFSKHAQRHGFENTVTLSSSFEKSIPVGYNYRLSNLTSVNQEENKNKMMFTAPTSAKSPQRTEALQNP
eukprot:4149735-Amphidinium_carterae.1